jgi:hypothetical protein
MTVRIVSSRPVWEVPSVEMPAAGAGVPRLTRTGANVETGRRVRRRGAARQTATVTQFESVCLRLLMLVLPAVFDKKSCRRVILENIVPLK